MKRQYIKREKTRDRKWWRRARVGKKNDARRKLTDEDRIEVKKLRGEGLSYAEIARAFGVSKRLIIFIINPEKLRDFQEKRKERKVWLEYYKKERNTVYQRKYRARLRTLYKKKEDGDA